MNVEYLYLAQLAHHLGLDQAAVAALEARASARIDAAAPDAPAPPAGQ